MFSCPSDISTTLEGTEAISLKNYIGKFLSGGRTQLARAGRVLLSLFKLIEHQYLQLYCNHKTLHRVTVVIKSECVCQPLDTMHTMYW